MISRPVIVEVYGTRALAELARGALEANGVEARVVSDDGGGLYPALGLVGGVRVVVDEDAIEVARRVLQSRPWPVPEDFAS